MAKAILVARPCRQSNAGIVIRSAATPEPSEDILRASSVLVSSERGHLVAFDRLNRKRETTYRTRSETGLRGSHAFFAMRHSTLHALVRPDRPHVNKSC